MRLAKPSDFDAVVEVFKPMRKDYFPHVRNDALKRKIAAGRVVFDEGVVITFLKYKLKRKYGAYTGLQVQVGDVHLEQIVTSVQGDGSATRVFQDFLKTHNTNVWLSVRADNLRARSFYEKNGMVEVGDINWKDATILGKVYLYKNPYKEYMK